MFHIETLHQTSARFRTQTTLSHPSNKKKNLNRSGKRAQYEFIKLLIDQNPTLFQEKLTFFFMFFLNNRLTSSSSLGSISAPFFLPTLYTSRASSTIRPTYCKNTFWWNYNAFFNFFYFFDPEFESLKNLQTNQSGWEGPTSFIS